MSEQQKRPQVGDVVWLSGSVVMHDDHKYGRWVLVGFGADDYRCWVNPANIHHIGDHLPAQERKPWETLREAAEILDREDCNITASNTRYLANQLESAAAPPEPVEVLREVLAYADENFPPALSHRMRAAIAAHDAKKDRTNG